MNPEKIIGKSFKDVQSQLGMTSVEPVYYDDQGGLEYLVLSSDGTWALSLSNKNRIETVYLYFNKGYDEFLGINLETSKADVVSLFGEPVACDKAGTHLMRGEYAAWEKISMEQYDFHVEHNEKEKGVKMITLSALGSND